MSKHSARLSGPTVTSDYTNRRAELPGSGAPQCGECSMLPAAPPKERRPPRRRSEYVAALGGLLAVVVLASYINNWLLYRSVRDEMDRLMGERLLSIATTLGRSLADRLPQLEEADATSLRSAAEGELRAVAAANDLDNITLVTRDGRVVVDLTGLAFGALHPLFAIQPEVQTVLISGLPQTTRLERVEVPGRGREFLKAGYAPIESRAGEITGVVAVEGGSAFFAVLPEMRRKVVTSALIGLALALVLGVAFFRSLRSLMRLEDSLRATAAMAAIGQIASVVAHEVKNPLAIIRSRAERVRAKIEGGRDSREVLEWFEAIPAEIDRLNEIVTSYLSLARPEQSAEGEAELGPVLEEIVRLLRADLAGRGISISLDLAKDAPAQVAMGARSLKQVVLNLVLNASQAIDAAGAIAVRTRPLGSGVALEVEDSGAGMTSREIARAYEPFYSTKATGSGLGLTLVQSLVHARGGRLDFDSAKGRGTVARVWLPVPKKEVS